MAKWGMVIDLDKCTACQSCVVACKSENNVRLDLPEEAKIGRSIDWITIIPFIEGEYPYVSMRLMPFPCMQCSSPPCTKVCPVFATYKNPEGIVAQIYYRCIGCRYCLNACPYTCKYFNWSSPKWPSELKKSLNPDVSPRTKGVVEKCNFCSHRLSRAREKAKAEGSKLKEEDYIPACVQACPTNAIIFGDLNNPESNVSKLSNSKSAFKVFEDLGTHPKVTYLTERTRK